MRAAGVALRVAFVWAIQLIFVSLVGVPAVRLLTSGPLQLLLGCLILLALVSSIRAAARMSAELCSGRYDAARRADRGT